MDDKTYRRMMWGCSCGHVARSAAGEARHRHNFPLLCRRPKSKKAASPTGRNPSEPNIQNVPVRTKEGQRIKEAFRKER